MNFGIISKTCCVTCWLDNKKNFCYYKSFDKNLYIFYLIVWRLGYVV
ncbi:Uncharacterised protein [Helicobacter pullorum]|uniref:Uncharacterized protein n=1 Tax=Helicobacter pullorum TaxID=35818 RepID=A0A377PY70_9HELI|nr:Uncharacterised protein [Helicobacter pullorum]